MLRDAGDIIDRYSIAILKGERIGSPEAIQEREVFKVGFRELTLRLPKPWGCWTHLLGIAIATNACIWDLESDLRREMLDNDLEETGRRAIQIRKINNIRVQLKNYINFTVGEGVQDVKRDHISENLRGDGGGGEKGEVGHSGDDMQDRGRASGELPECSGDTGGGVYGASEGRGQGGGEQGTRSGYCLSDVGRTRDYPAGDVGRVSKR